MTAQHELHSSPDTVHWGYFEAAWEPALRVESGDKVIIHTLTAEPDDLPPDGFDVLPELLEVHANCERGPGPHFITGPVWVNGAQPGDVLEVRILDCQLRQDWGWMIIAPLLGTLPEDFPNLHRTYVRMNSEIDGHSFNGS